MLIVAASVAALSVAAAPAAFADSGPVGVGGTVYVKGAPVYSVTVTPASVSFCSSATPLDPASNGACAVSGVIVTNTGAAGHINVTGADLVPSDKGTPWTLVPGGNASSNPPGKDQYSLYTSGNASGAAYSQTSLSTSPQCDDAFNPLADLRGNCAATVGQSASEQLNLIGPAGSTDTSSTFTTSITWTAGP